RASSELDALGQEFQTFRHLLRPREAKEIEATLKDLARTRDREAMVALRRRLRALSLEAAFWSELASGHKESNAIALVISRKGKEVLAKAGETAYLDDPSVTALIQKESERKAKSTFVMHLPVGRLVVMTGADASIAALFRRAPGKDVVSVLTKTVEAIEEYPAAATKTSEIRNAVAPRDFRKPKKWNRSRRGWSKWLRLYRAARLSMATRSKPFTRTRWSMYFRRTSNQFFDNSSSRCSRRILPMSRMYSSIASRPVMPSSVIEAKDLPLNRGRTEG